MAALTLFLTIASVYPKLHEALCHHRHEFAETAATTFTAAVLQDRPLVFEGMLRIADVFEGGVWMSLYAIDLDLVGR